MFCYDGSLKVIYHRGSLVVLSPNNLNKTNIFPAVFGVQRRDRNQKTPISVPPGGSFIQGTLLFSGMMVRITVYSGDNSMAFIQLQKWVECHQYHQTGIGRVQTYASHAANVGGFLPAAIRFPFRRCP